MKKRISLIIMACLAFSMLQGCGSKKDKKENTEAAKTEASSTADATEDNTVEDKTSEDNTSNVSDVKITQEMAYKGVSNFCKVIYGNQSGDVSSSEVMYHEDEETDTEYKFSYRSYTGAIVSFFVNKQTGNTRITEYVPTLDVESDGGSVDITIYIDMEVAEAPAVPEKQPGHYVFNPKVHSAYMEELFGETMCQAWYNLVDAILAGEDTFECPDYETYRWVMGQFPERLFPVLVDVLDYPLPEETAVIDGIAHFNYKYDHEQVSKRISDFENMIVEILNESMEDDYSDFEKVIALYNYFAHHYTYDYDLYERKQAGEFVELSSINFLDKGTGICQEISVAYSYILLQAGVEATTMGGVRGYDNMSHGWSYVKINGHEYHVDPTFVLDDNTLSYLMMNDERRIDYDGFDRSTFRITSNYSQDHPVPEFVANDDKFSPIWNTKFEAIDTEKDVLYCKYIDDNGVWQILEFDYSGY